MRKPFRPAASAGVTAALLLLAFVAVSSVSHASPVVPTVSERMAIPMYIDPGTAWTQADEGAPTVGILVMNPDSGPGTSQDAYYGNAVKAAQAKGMEVLGYVPTSYASGGVTVTHAEAWIGDYYAWYGVNGIFFDEVSDTCTSGNVSYYSTLYNFTKAEPGADLVILNPGDTPGSCYAAVSDILLTFEGNYSTYLSNYSGATWTSQYPPSHFWQVIYNASTLADMQDAVSLAENRGAGWVYVTDQGLPNPYGELPAYLSQEIAAINYPSITFTESGLPVGTVWSVTVNGTARNLTSSSLAFSEPDGTYSYTVGAPSGYAASPVSGTIVVSGAAVTQAVAFTVVSPTTYPVTFTENGLPTGTSWSVTVNGATQSSTTSSTAFMELSGTYSFMVGTVTGYTATPSSGTVTVQGGGASLAIQFASTSPPPTTNGGSGISVYYYIGGATAAVMATAGVGALLVLRRRGRAPPPRD